MLRKLSALEMAIRAQGENVMNILSHLSIHMDRQSENAPQFEFPPNTFPLKTEADVELLEKTIAESSPAKQRLVSL